MQHVPRRQTISSREFNQNIGKAKDAAKRGPVTITNRGRPAFVFMKYEDYQRLVEPEKPKQTLFDLLGQYEPEADFDFDPPRLSDDMGLRIPNFDED
jgi:prevent-host-death family protein